MLTCATTQAAPRQDDIAAYRALVQQDLRLATIGYRLAFANEPFCEKRERNPGWVIHDERQYPDRETARAAFGFRAPISISAVVPGGTADRLGIKAGDALLALDDSPFDVAVEARHKQSAVRSETVQQAVRQAFASSEPVKLILETAAGRRIFAVDPRPICASRFWVDAKAALDAGADGDGVRVTAGLMEFVGDDHELAAAVAHELAHNILGHRQLLASKPGIKSTRATEIEADRLSVWLMANAGYDPTAALRFAERYGRKTGLGIFSASTHPRWKNRVKIMQSEIDLMATTPKQDGLLRPPSLSVVNWSRTTKN